MTNFQNYLLNFITALPFGFLSVVLILIRKPTTPDTGWYVWLITCPIAVIVFGCLGMMLINSRLEKGRKKAFDKILRERQVLQEARKMPPPPNDYDGPEAA